MSRADEDVTSGSMAVWRKRPVSFRKHARHPTTLQQILLNLDLSTFREEPDFKEGV